MLVGVLVGVCLSLVVIIVWMCCDSEVENIRVNSVVVRNLLVVLELVWSVEHVALMIGFKYYFGLFEVYGKVVMVEILFCEIAPRLDYLNFYYV